MKTFEEWVIKANSIYNNLYEYINLFKKDDGYYYFNIKCKLHGTFEKRIVNHINKNKDVLNVHLIKEAMNNQLI